MALVEYGRHEIEGLPDQVRQIPADQTYGFQVSYTTLVCRGQPVTVWFLEASPAGQSAAARRALRMCLIRLHADYQALNLVLGAVAGGADPATDDGRKALLAFLDSTTRRLFGKERFHINAVPLHEALTAYRLFLDADERALVLEQLKGVKKQLFARVAAVTAPSAAAGRDERIDAFRVDEPDGRTVAVHYHIAKVQTMNVHDESTRINVVNSQIGRDLIAAGKIVDSFKPQQAGRDDKLAEALKALLAVVQQHADQIPADKQKEVGGRVKDLTNEATKPDADKDVVQLFANKIIAAVSSVAVVAGPVTTAVQAVLKFFGL